ncbi:MAG: hypothetical protein M3Z24_08465 [Chloroflexota bacterium]|nr:hypothetical protein [Chloroflexota bacterium]
MDYETAIQIFFQPPPEGTTTPYPVVHASAARRLRDACEPLGIHAAWSRRTNERLAALGLNFLTAYVWGRAACLGDVPATLVVAAFAAFEPGLITATYEEARRQVSRDELLAVRDEATSESLQKILGDADITSAVNVLRRGLSAVDGTGRALFSGLLARPWPESPAGQLWRACDLVREHRGDSHIAAYITACLGPVDMNILTELYVGMPLGSYTATRGWSAEAIDASVEHLQKIGLIADGALTPAGLRLREEIEEQTDAMEQPLIEAIGSDFEALVTQLNEWGELCIKAGAFPPNIQKRAAG